MADNKPLAARRIVMGITGSIAAYKAAEIASCLTRAGAEVSVIMTTAAQKFICPLTFESITHRTVYTGLFAEHSIEPRHIALAESAEIILIAPATANSIGKIALGLADDLLSAIALATRAPILIAPAMNDGMYTHPAVQTNISTLKGRGVIFIGPEEGRLASGKIGTGRMSSPEAICRAVAAALTGDENAIC